MKKIKNVLYCFLFLSVFSSCSDFLDRTPLDFISPDNYLTNENQAEKLLNGVYQCLMASGEGNDRLFPIHLATLTDDAFDSQPWHSTSEWPRGQGNAQSGWPQWKWSQDYRGISRANVFLNSIESASFSSSLIPRYIGEAKFLRAWYYLDLVTFYGDVPLVLEPGDLSNSMPGRTPKQEVIAQILLDLEDAIKTLPLTYEEKESGRITKGAAMGLKSRVLLYESRWAEAAEVAQAVIDLNVYSLFPDYQGLFLERNEGAATCEVMFQRYYSPQVDPSYLYYPIGEWPAFSPTKQLVDCYYMNDGLPIGKSSRYDRVNPHMNRDPRFYASIFYPGCKYLNFMLKAPDPALSTDSITIYQWLLNVSGYRSKKHLDGSLTDSKAEGRNTYFMRYAEILLNFAEAKNETEGPVKAVYDAIDMLRDRANMVRLSTVMPGLSKEQMREEIRNERRIELAFEGMRWADIRRWRIGEKVMVDAWGLDNSLLKEGMYPGDGKGEGENWKYEYIVIDQRQFNPQRDYLWPIPQNEMDANENMVQNPGY